MVYTQKDAQRAARRARKLREEPFSAVDKGSPYGTREPIKSSRRRRVKTRDPKEQLIPRGSGVKVKLPPPPKPGPGRRGGRGAPPPPSAPFPGWNAIAQGQLGPIYDPVLGEYARLIQQQQAETAAQAKAKQDAFRMFAEWYGKNAPGQVQDIYRQAGADQSYFAKGMSDGWTHAQRGLASEANKQIGIAGGPAEQQIHVGTEGGDVIYGMGGLIPSNMMSQQGAAFAAAAALQPPAIFAEGARQAGEITKAGNEDISKLRMEEAQIRSDLAAKTASLAQDLREQGQARKAAKLEAAQKKAEYLTDKTGWVYIVKKGKPFKTKRRTVDYLEAVAKAKADVADASKPERISISLSESYGVLVDVNGQVVRGKNGKPIPYVPYQAPSKDGGGSSGGGGSSQSGSRYYVIQTADGLYRVDKRTGKMTKLKGGGGSAAGSTAPLSAKDRATATSAARAGIRNGMSWEELVRDSGEWPIDQAAALKIAAREYGGTISNGKFSYTQGGLTRLGKSGSLGFNFVRAVAISMGYKPAGKGNLRKFTAYILARQGKGSAVPSGGENAAFSDPSVPPQVNTAISAAMQQLGQKYVWGAEDRSEGGFDCSGLIDWAFRQAGVDFPGRLTTWSAIKMGRAVPPSALRPGDFIISNGGKHMTMYIGNGKVIAASSARGRVVIMALTDLGPILGARRLTFGQNV